MNEIYTITDLDGYIHQVRATAANFLTENSFEEDDLDDFISVRQLTNLVRNSCIGFDDNDRPLLDEDTNEKIFETTVTWIHNVGLAKLAGQDLIECAWDDENNEMIFWPKKKASNNAKSSKSKNKRKNKDS